MAHVSSHRTIGSSLSSRIAGLHADLTTRYSQYRAYRTTLGELSNLTTRELADMGIHPANIRSIAYEAAYK